MALEINVKNKIILITGGYGYLGKAIVSSMLKHGGIIYVLGKDQLKFTTSFLDINDKHLHFEYCDVSDSEKIKCAFKKIYDKEGRIDVLINNAFYSRGQSPETMTDEDWSYSIEGTLDSTFKCIREIIPFFTKDNSGKIINVSSMYGLVAPDFDIYKEAPEFLNPPHYGAAKAGIIQLTKYYASYLGKFDIQVNAVTPGPFPSLEVQNDKNFIEKLINKTTLNRIGKPEDLAGAFVFLSSAAADYITGQNIIVDGGWTIK